MYPQIKTTSAMVWCVVSFLCWKWIPMIFFVMAYEKYDKAHNYTILREEEIARMECNTADHNLHVGIVLFFIFLILEIVISTIAVLAFAGLFFV